MGLRQMLCSVGIHKYHVVELTDCFYTTYTEKPEWPPIKHMLYYRQCSCCGKRSTQDTYAKDAMISGGRHNGIEYAKVAWIEHGKVYLGSDKWKAEPPQKPRATVVPFTVYTGDKK